MESREKTTQLEYQAIDIQLLFGALYDVVRYNEEQTGKFSSAQILCEIIDEKISNLMNLF